MSYVIAVDTGGTFTDTIVVDSEGQVAVAKAASTPDDFARGVLDSVTQAAQVLGLSLEELLSEARIFGHGTTVGINTLLTRSGRQTGLITTRGHEEAIIIGRTIQKVAGRSEAELTHLARLDKADPIVPRPYIRGVRERVDWTGKVVIPLTAEDVRQAVAELIAAGCETIAVSLLWSFMHPDHERLVRKIIHGIYPDLPVSLSHEVVPVIKEYERTATTAINAYIGKATGHYLSTLSSRLRESGFRHEALIMQSSGGVAPIKEAQARAVTLLSSGPAGGVVGAVALGRALGCRNVITTDMGGTSFDVGLVVDGEPQFSLTPVFSQYHTLLPSIDVVSIGAGGGSIAWLEPVTNLLKVGPRSAGAEPGPVCYGAGGTEPTVTDANVVLNRLNPDYFLGGARKLDAGLARQAISEKIAAPMGLSVEEAALGIIDILDARMADLVRKVTIERGYDPADFVLLAFGGAGPLHVGAFASEIGVKEIIIPAHSSEYSARGIAGSDLVYLHQLSDPQIAPFDPERLNRTYQLLEEKVRAGLHEGGVDDEAIRMLHSVTMRYHGQIHEVQVPVPVKELGPAELDDLLLTFETIYDRKYGEGAAYRQAGVEAHTFQVRGLGLISRLVWARQAGGDSDASTALKDRRPVYFKGGCRETPIYDHAKMRAGHRIVGPALVEAVDTTVLVQPGQTLRIDEYDNIWMEVQQ
ncbi:MAG TPA: hypothetical protein DEP84_29375 [Chloroflexi bacterium]|nr:hypothetical protein [Chloroflexota bacterium]